MSKSWLGSIESIELDWHEGLYVETLASPQGFINTRHGAQLDIRPTGVYYSAHCCLCEWAYSTHDERRPPLPSPLDTEYGRITPDIEEVLGWARGHRKSRTHVDAVGEFRRKKRLMAGAGDDKHG